MWETVSTSCPLMFRNMTVSGSIKFSICSLEALPLLAWAWALGKIVHLVVEHEAVLRDHHGEGLFQIGVRMFLGCYSIVQE